MRHFVTDITSHARHVSVPFLPSGPSGDPAAPAPGPSFTSPVRMSRFRSSLIAAGALALLAACDEAAAPEGTSGDLQVRAYIDRDASGAYSAPADSGLTGVQLTATPMTGGAAISATTDAAGLATFADLAPGSYTIAIAGGQPEGAVLTTNPQPTISVSFQGAVNGAPEFRWSFLPLVVEGRIYRDDNGDGDYDQGIDTPGAGLFAVLKANTNNAPGATVDSVVADTAGLFRFARVAPGSYFVQLEQLPTFDYGQAGALRPLVVGTTAPAPVPAVFTGSLVLPIGTARNRPVTANVEVEGFVTVPPNLFTSGSGGVNSEIWIQDATGGIAVFSVLSNRTDLGLGKRIRVRGTRTDFSGQEQIAGTLTVTVLADSVVQASQLVTGAQAVARTGFEGELVTLSGFTVDSLPAAAGTGGYTVRGVAADGTTLRIRAQNATLIPKSVWVLGNRYSITGILTENGGLAQVKPRGTGDIAGPTAIGTVRTSPQGQLYTISGTVTVAPSSFPNGSNAEVWVQDATGGIAVFGPAANYPAGLALGDRVEVTGTLGAFANQLQLASTPTITRLGAGTPVAPRTVLAADLAARTYEGQLVTVQGFTVTTIGTANTAGAYNVTGTIPTAAGGTQTLVIRVNGTAVGLPPGTFTVGQTYSITGVATINNATVQIKPRFRADVTP